MRSALAAYCIGVMLGSYVIHLQASLLTNVCLAVCCIGGQVRWRRELKTQPVKQRCLLLLTGISVGLAYHAAWGWQATAARLPQTLAGLDVVVTGTVINLPQPGEVAARFLFRVKTGPEPLRGARILLRDYDELAISGGQRWQFTVRLQPPRGLANPGTFDYEAWLLQQRIRATGYVRDPDTAQRLGVNRLSLAWWRQRVADRVARLAASDPLLSMLLPALVLGERGQIDGAMWDTLTRTGTNHLFVISGLHVGLVASWCYFLASQLLRLLPLPATAWPVQKLAAIAAIAGAACYSLIAGFGLPAQRALVMIVIFMLGSLTGRSINIGLRLLLALTLVLTINPLAGGGPGFWLSFMAVAALLLFMHRGESDWWQRHRWQFWDTLIKPQWVVFLALFMPLSLWMGQVSLIAPLVNMLAIPVLALVIVPLAMLAVITSLLSVSVAGLLLNLMGAVLDWTVRALHLMAFGLGDFAEYLQFYPPAPNWFALVLAGMAVSLLLLPLPLAWRWLALPLGLTWLLPGKAVYDRDTLALHVLDVGQGLAVVVQHRQQFLLYDTGARLGEDFDMGTAVVLPVLARLGVKELDWLIISHGDNDHAGGYRAVAAALPARQLLVGGTVDIGAAAALPCQAGQRWRWQGAEIRVLHPDRAYDATNNNSCVVQLRYGDYAVLLTGDITREVERQLARRYGAELRSVVMLAPHHGSRTSSSYPLLKAVAPDWVVFSAASNNSFGHPADEVVARYRGLGIGTLNTAETGMISFRPGAPPETFRARQRRYWRWSQNAP